MKLRLLTVLLIACSTTAEFRIWESADGKAVEAELVSVQREQVFLKKRSGKTFRLPISSLCEGDQDFAKAQIHPDLVLKVNKRVDSKGVWNDAHFNVSIDVRNPRGYDGNLEAILMVIGKVEAEPFYLVMDRSNVSLPCKKGEKLNMATQQIHFNSGSVDVCGYALIVRNGSGRIVASECSKGIPGKYLGFLLDQPMNFLFNSDYTTLPSKEPAYTRCDYISGRTSRQGEWTKRLWFRRSSRWHQESGLSPSEETSVAEVDMNVRGNHSDILCQLYNRKVISEGDFSIRTSFNLPSGYLGLFSASGRIGRIAIPVSSRKMQTAEIKRENGVLTFAVDGRKVAHASTQGMKGDQGDLLFGALIYPGHGTYRIESAKIEVTESSHRTAH